MSPVPTDSTRGKVRLLLCGWVWVDADCFQSRVVVVVVVSDQILLSLLGTCGVKICLYYIVDAQC